MVETLTEPTEETLVEVTAAATVATRAGTGLPEMMPPTSDATLLHPTTSMPRMTDADTRRPIGASPSASSAALKRPSRTVISSNSSAPPLLPSAGLTPRR